jgi:hypothetical protein
VLKTEDVKIGTKAAAPSNPARKGYTFAGWDSDVNVAITASKTFTAKYTAIPAVSIAGTALESAIATRTFTGKAIKPAFKLVWLNPETSRYEILVAGKDYTATYTANTNVGSGTITVKGIGTFGDSKVVKFSIKPKKGVVSKATAGKKKVTVTWKKAVDKAGKYQLRYKVKGTKKWKTKTVAGSKTKASITKLKKGKAYYVEVRAYKKVSGKNVYGAWSKVKTSKKVK